ncbi:PD-(D/E)XK nuclease family protein [Candidatus Omnitrophota bacterium]
MGNNYTVSPSSLNLFLECPRCFWLYLKQKISRPRPPTSTLPTGMDNLIKRHFDRYRSLGMLPPELEGKIKAKPVQQALMDKWRNWRIGLSYQEEGVCLRGGLDECLLEGEIYIPVDYKTRGFPLKENSASYYQNQLNLYSFLLEKNNFRVSPFAYLVFYILQSLSDNGDAKFDIQLIKMNTDTQKAYQVFRQAGNLLRQAGVPEASMNCEFCAWARNNLHAGRSG